ncbi:hypothetical protein PG989_009077 [Apiospora arundinis]
MSTAFTSNSAQSHHRRRSSTSGAAPPAVGYRVNRPNNLAPGSSRLLNPSNLSPIPGTMPLSRSPSPVPGGGWSSPGLNINSSGQSSPATASFSGPNGSNVTWESARLKSQGGFRLSLILNSKPRVLHSPYASHIPKPSYLSNEPGAIRRERETGPQQMECANAGQGTRHRGACRSEMEDSNDDSRSCTLLLVAILVDSRTTWLGGGQKFVIILAANVGGGVMEWKGAREWAIERDSVRNKRKYVSRWGYDLEIIDMSTKKRYAHEWRESWEKVDSIRNSFRKYPKAEWVWWLDLNTFVMEPSYSLQDHIFNNLEKHIYRDINEYNPLNISHPLKGNYLDEASQNVQGDGDPNSVNLILPQDCSGFNLGSFFVRRSDWTDRLLDIWWDPVAYEQKHMEWEHKEQDALEQLYTTQPWIRKHTAFLPQRKINSFPNGACSDNGMDTRIHYDQNDRDFVVNMAGCEWGRDCWGEMYNFRELSYYLNRNPWERFKEDLIAVIWFKLTGQKVKL